MEEEQRFKELFRYVMELANGNFSYRLRIKGKNNLETMAILLNMLAEELEVIKWKKGSDLKNLSGRGMLLVINENQQIVAVNNSVAAHLKRKEREIIGVKVTELLTEESAIVWKGMIKKIYRSGKDFQFRLSFLIGDKFKINSNFSVLPLINYKKGMVLLTELQKEAVEIKEDVEIVEAKKGVTPVIRLEEDFRKIKEVHDFVLKNVYNDLPSLKEMANEAGTNEHKLKSGFKEIYGTTIFRYQTQKRLKQAELLIKNTPLSIKTIADSTGYKSFPHFSRSFKKKYGCSPREFRKRFM